MPDQLPLRTTQATCFYGSHPPGEALKDRARQLIADTVVWDSHGCMPLDPLDEQFLPALERYRQAGVDVVFLNVGFGDHGIEQHIRMLAHFRRWLGSQPDRYALATSIAAIHAARASGRLAVGFDIEGMNAIADQLSLVQLYYDLGVRWMLIAYNRNNPVGGGCQDEDGGLTQFGRRVIEEMTRVGMLLCCSHTGERTAREAIDHSANPVIFSHSNPRAVWDHQRNISDALMLACARRGGVIGINGIGAFLGDNDNGTETIVRHIDYAVSLVGDRHVGLGLDYVFDAEELDAYIASKPELFPPSIYRTGIQLVAPEQIEPIVTELMRLGYGDDTLRRILGGNFLGVAQAVWR